MLRRIWVCCWFCCWGAGVAFGQLSKAETKQMLRMLQSAPTFDAVIDSLSLRDYHPDLASFEVVRAALWERLLEDQNRNPEGRRAFERGECKYGDGKIGRFSMVRQGIPPEKGWPVYIGLHGGGGGPQEMNDEQWESMQRYYLPGIENGIYVAPRGPNNTWNLHFDDDALAFYQQLIRDIRLYEGVDPNRIYLLGYSAGGDGVYQLAPRLAPELAAANMSAGHHNGVPPTNLQHLPMLLQVGELDAAYDRNVETVRYNHLLDSLARLFPGQYLHQLYVHAGAKHSYVQDRIGASRKAPVLADPEAWVLNHKVQDTVMAPTSAPSWLQKFHRNPCPLDIRWDLGTRHPANSQWYWLSVDLTGAKLPEGKPAMVQVTAFPDQNRIVVKEFHGTLQLHLNEQFLDHTRPLTVVVDGAEYVVPLHPSMLAMARSLKTVGDAARMDWQVVTIVTDARGKITVR